MTMKLDTLIELFSDPAKFSEKIKPLHTKQLMQLMEQQHNPFWNDRMSLEQATLIRSQLNAELATREHVANKLEAKRNRQEKAKHQRNQ